MAYPHRMRHRWRDAWRSVTPPERRLLQSVIDGISEAGVSRAQIAEAAEVEEHHVRSVQSGRKLRGHWPGMRLLRYAAQWGQQPGEYLPPKLSETQDRLRAVAGRLSTYDPDADYFFRHLERLRVITLDDCKKIANELKGNYHSYRLSRNQGKIIRSHYEIQKFNSFNRIPHFVNKLKYGNGPDGAGQVERTAQGQIFPMLNSYIFLGFVSWGYSISSRDRYDGLQVGIFPSNIFDRNSKTIHGIFLSYVYTDKYEVGPMKLVRSDEKFDESRVGEFSIDEIKKMCPDVDISDLALDVSESVRVHQYPGIADKSILETCLSFAFTVQGMSFFAPDRPTRGKRRGT